MINELHIALDLLAAAKKTIVTIPHTAASPKEQGRLRGHVEDIDIVMEAISNTLNDTIPDLHG